MKREDYHEFERAFNQTSEALRGPSGSDVVSGYFEALRRFSLDEVRSVLRDFMQKSEWFPKPKEVIRDLQTKRAEQQDESSCEMCGGMGWVMVYSDLKRSRLYTKEEHAKDPTRITMQAQACHCRPAPRLKQQARPEKQPEQLPHLSIPEPDEVPF